MALGSFTGMFAASVNGVLMFWFSLISRGLSGPLRISIADNQRACYTDTMNENIAGPPVALMERLSFLLKSTFALLEGTIEPELARLGINGREFGLLTLIEAEGPASQQRLASRIGVDRTTMVGLIDALEEKGLVERHKDPSNRRAYLLEVTAAGRKKLRDALKAVERAEQLALAPLSVADSATLTRILQRLVEARPDRA
jgi:DNA-binding MarR family transcriptional regulator